MKKNLPTSSPVEGVAISPENLDIANLYLETNSSEEVARLLDLPREVVTRVLSKREVKAYIDHVYMETGYANRNKLRLVVDKLIDAKLQELDEAEIGSSKDILELLQFAHKMRMDELKAMKEIAETNIKTQNNVQINAGGDNYQALLSRLLDGAK